MDDLKPTGYVILTLDILEDKRLTTADKFVLARMTGFDRAGGHYESIGNTAKALGISERTVQRAHKRLEELGYIEIVGISELGTKLVKIKTLFPEGVTKCQGGDKNAPRGVTKCHPIIKKENKDLLKDKSFNKNESEPPKRYGNAEVNALLDAWAEATGFNYANQKMERYAMGGLIKQHGIERMKELVRLVKEARQADDRFAPQIAKPSQLRGKYSKLEALVMWAEKRNSRTEPEKPRGPILKPFEFDDEIVTSTKEERHEIAKKCREIAFGGRK